MMTIIYHFCYYLQPLASFFSAIDTINLNIQECLFVINDDMRTSLSKIEKNLKTIFLSNEVVRSTTSIIVMNINLCIDYIKVRNDVNLIPEFDNINIKDSLEHSINMIRNQDFRFMHINFIVSSDLVENIITDRMWFCENIYSILSNVIMKSSDVAVEISVSMKSFLQKKQSKKSRKFNFFDLLPVIREDEDDIEIALDDWTSGVYAKSGIVEQNNVDQDRQIFLLIEVQGSGTSVSFDFTSDVFEVIYHIGTALDDIKSIDVNLYCFTKRVITLGGNYGISSRKDAKVGCVLWFMIPLIPNTEFCPPQQDRFKTLDLINPQSKSILRVLIVCDKYSSLFSIGDSLLESGYNYDYVDNGPDALKMVMDNSATDNQYNAVLLDLNMPMAKNFNFVRRLRHSEKARNDIPNPQLVIGISQSLEYGDTSKALNSGVNAFATYPISIEYLNEIINTFQSSLSNKKNGKNNKVSLAI